MDKSQLIIKIIDLYWLNGEKDDVDDLCLHGDVYVRIGEEVVVDNYSCTVSSTALYLLKSLEEDHIPVEGLNQMLPCCGFFIIPNDHDDIVEISGCSNGIDWSVIHMDGYVKLVTERGTEVKIEKSSYREIVFNFVDKIEAFYRNCKEKSMPTDDFEHSGYIKFWKEWRNRRHGQSF